MTKDDVNLIQSLNSSGIYIYISPSNRTAYVGKSRNVYKRLRTHLRDAFIDFEYSQCKSEYVLTKDDVEMYCCFLEGREEYDYSGINNLDEELRILESFMMDVMKDNGYELVNGKQGEYDIRNLESKSIHKYENQINLGDNVFKFGLNKILKLQLYYNTSSIDKKIKKLDKRINDDKIEINKLNNRINEYELKIDRLNKQINEYEIKIDKLNNQIKLNAKELYNYEYTSNQIYNLYKDFILDLCKNPIDYEYKQENAKFIDMIVNSSNIKTKNLDLISKIDSILDENIHLTNILNKDILLEIIKLSSYRTIRSLSYDLENSGYKKYNIIKKYFNLEHDCVTKIYNIISDSIIEHA